jgi:hypothetical protein
MVWTIVYLENMNQSDVCKVKEVGEETEPEPLERFERNIAQVHMAEAVGKYHRPGPGLLWVFNSVETLLYKVCGSPLHGARETLSIGVLGR